MDWSHALLSEMEQVLFRRLSVFRGGWSLSGAEAVGIGEAIDASMVLDLLQQLVEKSLVESRSGAAEQRYRMLQVVRQYAAEKLEESGEATAIRDQHLDYFLVLAEEAEPELMRSDQAAWLDRLADEHSNMREALLWSRQAGDAERALRLSGALGPFWLRRGHWGEGRDLLASIVEMEGASERSPARGRALNALARLAARQGDYDEAQLRYEESLTVFRERGDGNDIAHSLHLIGHAEQSKGDYETAKALYEESLEIGRESGFESQVVVSLTSLGELATTQGDYAKARGYLDEALAIHRHLGNWAGLAGVHSSLGVLAHHQGDKVESLALHREIGNTLGISHSLASLGVLAYSRGDYATSRRLTEESVAIQCELGHRSGVAYSLCNLGYMACQQCDFQTARTSLEEALEIFSQLDDKQGAGRTLQNLGIAAAFQGETAVALNRGDSLEARNLLEESLSMRRQLQQDASLAACLEGYSRIALAERDARLAAHLLGAASALRDALGAALPPVARSEHECTTATARSALGDSTYENAYAEGATLTTDEAVAHALGEVTWDELAPVVAERL